MMLDGFCSLLYACMLESNELHLWIHVFLDRGLVLLFGCSLRIKCHNMNIFNILVQTTIFMLPLVTWKTRILVRFCKRRLLDNLSKLQHAPSVQFQERPPDTELPEADEDHDDADDRWDPDADVVMGTDDRAPMSGGVKREFVEPDSKDLVQFGVSNGGVNRRCDRMNRTG